MPVGPCQENGKPGWRWGGHGKCYTYTEGDKEGSTRAHSKAEAQGRAAHAHGYRGDKPEDEDDDWDRFEYLDEISSSLDKISSSLNVLKNEGGERIDTIEQKLPDIHPNESEQDYVSRCIEFETKHSPDRPKEQISRMCYEKYRSRGQKSNDVNLNEATASLERLTASLDALKKNTLSKLTPQYYSTAKPFYRFEYNILQKELEGADWNSKPLLIDIKCDGLRLSIGKIKGVPFAHVDPESLKEKSSDVSERLPLIMRELESIPDNTILDGEFIAIKDGAVLHRTVANAILNSTHTDPKVLEQIAHIFIFDVLYFNGQDIRSHPLHERVEYLGQIKPTEHILVERNTKSLSEQADGYYVDGANFNDIQIAINNIFTDKTGRPPGISEGVMIKTLEHQYEYPQNHGWGKCKKHYEVDCVVWDMKLVKGQNDVFNYFLGINVEQEHYNHLPNNIKVPGKLLMFFGKSNATKIVCEVGDVLRVASEEVLKTDNNGYPYYRGYISVPLEKIPEKNVSDSLEVLDKLSSFQPKRIPMEEINRIESSLKDPELQIEDIAYKPSSQQTDRPNEETPGEEVLESFSLKEGDKVSYKDKVGTIRRIIWQ